MTENGPDGIGGFLPLERGNGVEPGWIQDALAFRSARSAMHAWFVAMRPARIWLPYYICADVLPAVPGDVDIQRYALADDLGPAPGTPIGHDDVVVLVDYLGLTGHKVHGALKRLDRRRTLVDASQSLGFAPSDALHVVYSPRKFFGLPDGGLLISDARIPAPAPGDDHASLERCRHLVLRRVGRRAEGHDAFRQSEASLERPEPDGMSLLTRGLLASVDHDTVRDTRQANYERLLRRLGAPQAPFDVPGTPLLPLVFPLACTRSDEVRLAMRERGVFVPHYWPGLAIPEFDPWGRLMNSSVLCLPCDQRYDASHMDVLAAAVESILQTLE